MARDVCIEYGHAYLNELVDGKEPPDLTRVADALDYYDDAVTVVIVDDTAHNPGIPRDDTFEERRTRLTVEYIEKLSITPDIVCFESDFGPAIRAYLSDIPTIPEQELTPDIDLGAYYSLSSEGLYLYAGDGTELTSVRITDQRKAAKATGYSCGAYDAAMTLAKLGEVPAPDAGMVADRAITFHDPGYIGCPPYKASRTIRTLLAEHGHSNHSEEQVENIPITVPDDAADEYGLPESGY